MTALGDPLLAAFVVAFLVHEYAHWVAARMLGWQTVGWRASVRHVSIGIGVVPSADHTPGDFALAAGAGVAASINLAWLASQVDSEFAWSLAVVSPMLAVAQLVPLRGTDGWHMARGAAWALRRALASGCRP